MSQSTAVDEQAIQPNAAFTYQESDVFAETEEQHKAVAKLATRFVCMNLKHVKGLSTCHADEIGSFFQLNFNSLMIATSNLTSSLIGNRVFS